MDFTQLSDGERQDVKVAVRRVSASASLPEYETDGAAGMDLRASVEAPVTLQPGERRLIGTGIAIALPSPRLVALVFARSGLASKHGIGLANGVGVIDSDYRGEIMCSLLNGGPEPFTIRPGERIAQLVVVPVVAVRWHEVDVLPATERGAGGFGSTGSS